MDWIKLVSVILLFAGSCFTMYDTVITELRESREHREAHGHDGSGRDLVDHEKRIDDIEESILELTTLYKEHTNPINEIHETKYQKQIGIQLAMKPMNDKVMSIEKKVDKIIILQEAERAERHNKP